MTTNSCTLPQTTATTRDLKSYLVYMIITTYFAIEQLVSRAQMEYFFKTIYNKEKITPGGGVCTFYPKRKQF
jgi:uncharacterized protein (DUF2344 family)